MEAQKEGNMSFSKQEQEKLKSIMRQAYQEKENLEIGDLGQDDLMLRIWEFGAIQSAPRFLTMFEQIVWQLAPVISLLILALTGVLLVLDLTPGYDVFQLLMNGKEEITLSQMVGG
jgi:hypothetical protein